MQRLPRNQDISWFLDQHERGLLDLSPPYQRRSVWTRKDREFFIDTILHNYPSPAIFLHKTIDANGKAIHHVVDGKQRLETIIEFTKNNVRVPRDFGDERLNGRKWDDLDQDTKRAFWDYSISIELLPVIDEAVVNSVFERINRNSRKLTAQELRHAKFDGWFSTFVENQAADEDWENLGLVTKARAKRMQDVQFLSELLIVAIDEHVTGFDQDQIDEYYAEYEDPDTVEVPFDTDAIEARFNRAKAFLRDMIAADGGAKAPIKTLANLYSLWGWLMLIAPDDADPRAVAPKYVAFMSRVVEFQRDAMLQINPDQAEFDQAASDYAVNVRGASTDERQRRERHRALASGLAAAP